MTHKHIFQFISSYLKENGMLDVFASNPNVLLQNIWHGFLYYSMKIVITSC